MCNISLEESFDTEITTFDISIADLVATCPAFVLIGHERHLFVNKVHVNPNEFLTSNSLLNCLRKHKEADFSFVYHNPLIPVYIPIGEVLSSVALLSFKEKQITLGNEVLNINSLRQRKLIALHLRGTDYGFSEQYFARWFLFVKFYPGKVLLLTDDESLLERFSKLKNVALKGRSTLPKKYNKSLSWNGAVKDEYGREFTYNIVRDKDSILDSLVDLYILSQSIKLFTSRSTFLQHAYLFSGDKKSIFLLNELNRFLHILRFFKKASKSLLGGGK